MEVSHGASQTFTITPKTDYLINSVLVNGVNQCAITSYTFNNVTTNHTIHTEFTYVPPVTTYTFNVSAGTGGTVSGTTSGSYTVGTQINVTAHAGSGYNFNHWSASGKNLGNQQFSSSVSFLMPTNGVSMIAYFNQTGGNNDINAYSGVLQMQGLTLNNISIRYDDHKRGGGRFGSFTS